MRENTHACVACKKGAPLRVLQKAISARNGLGTGSDPGPLTRTCAFPALRQIAFHTSLCWACVQMSWHAQHFGSLRCRFCRRRRAFADSGAVCMTGAAFWPHSQGQVQTSWQTKHFCKIKRTFRGWRSTFARSGTDCATGAGVSQGQVLQISWQAQDFRKVKCRFRGRRSVLDR